MVFQILVFFHWSNVWNVFQIPNGFGCGLGTVQLILYAIYRNNKGENKKPTAAEESMEMKKSNGKFQQQKQSNNLHQSQDEQV